MADVDGDDDFRMCFSFPPLSISVYQSYGRNLDRHADGDPRSQLNPSISPQLPIPLPTLYLSREPTLLPRACS